MKPIILEWPKFCKAISWFISSVKEDLALKSEDEFDTLTTIEYNLDK